MKDFTISINQVSAEVRLEPSSRSPHAKLGGALFVASMGIVALCVLLFLPRRDGHSMWQYISNANIEFGSFLAGIQIVGCGLLLWMGFRWSAAAWPSDETLRCDHTTLTISHVPYLDFRNRTWKTTSYALRDIERFRFAVYASARGSSKYGFRFRANGKRHKTLPGLEAPEAQNILNALQAFGVDVVLDDKLQKKVAETLERRGSQIS